MMQIMGQRHNIIARGFGALVRAAGIASISAVSLFLSAPAQAGSDWSASDDDALLFDLRSGKYRLGDGIRQTLACALTLPMSSSQWIFRFASTKSRAAQLAGYLRKARP
jgi:hypothetical protein